MCKDTTFAKPKKCIDCIWSTFAVTTLKITIKLCVYFTNHLSWLSTISADILNILLFLLNSTVKWAVNLVITDGHFIIFLGEKSRNGTV